MIRCQWHHCLLVRHRRCTVTISDYYGCCPRRWARASPVTDRRSASRDGPSHFIVMRGHGICIRVPSGCQCGGAGGPGRRRRCRPARWARARTRGLDLGQDRGPGGRMPGRRPVIWWIMFKFQLVYDPSTPGLADDLRNRPGQDLTNERKVNFSQSTQVLEVRKSARISLLLCCKKKDKVAHFVIAGWPLNGPRWLEIFRTRRLKRH